MAILQIDGLIYDVKCEITRIAEIVDSGISGKLLDRTIFHDVDGTYLEYDIRFTFPLYDQNRYSAIIEKLYEPVASHEFVLPYNQEAIMITAKVDVVSDDVLELEDGTRYWRNTRFTLSSNAPIKRPTLGGVISAGMPPTPNISAPAVGDTYTWNGSEWAPYVAPPDADNVPF